MKFAVRTLLALALLPALGFASTIDFANQGGVLTGSTAGLVLSGSMLVGIDGAPPGLITGNLGTVNFNTGQLVSGSLQMGGTFANDGNFLITGNGTDNIPNGVIFAGIFSGPVTFSLITLENGTHNYTMTGVLTGETFNGIAVDGATIQLSVNTGTGFFDGSGTLLSSGNTTITGNGIKEVVPEPGSLSLMGTGIVALCGLVRRRLGK
jgi:hypothetical protein